MTAQVTVTKNKPQILTVKLKIEGDPDYPLRETLGSFDAKPLSKVAINHHRRQGTSREYEWFNPAAADTHANAERDYLEMMEFAHDRKWMMRVVGSATVDVPCGSTSVTARAGPYHADGFDSNDEDGCKNAQNEIREEISDELVKMGFSRREITHAMNHIEIEEN